MNGPKKIRIFLTPGVDCPVCLAWGSLSRVRMLRGRISSLPIQVVDSGPCPRCKGRGYLIGGLLGLVLEVLYAGLYPYRAAWKSYRYQSPVRLIGPLDAWKYGRKVAKDQIKLIRKDAGDRYGFST